jgi:hypothetical protein
MVRVHNVGKKCLIAISRFLSFLSCIGSGVLCMAVHCTVYLCLLGQPPDVVVWPEDTLQVSEICKVRIGSSARYAGAALQGTQWKFCTVRRGCSARYAVAVLQDTPTDWQSNHYHPLSHIAL